MNWKAVLRGAYNYAVVNEEIEKIAKERRAICDKCSYNSGGLVPLCNKCGCVLAWKTRNLAESCPYKPPKWQAIKGVTQDEANQIDEIIDNE